MQISIAALYDLVKAFANDHPKLNLFGLLYDHKLSDRVFRKWVEAKAKRKPMTPHIVPDGLWTLADTVTGQTVTSIGFAKRTFQRPPADPRDAKIAAAEHQVAQLKAELAALRQITARQVAIAAEEMQLKATPEYLSDDA